MKELTEAEKTQYTRSALGLAGVAVNDFIAEMIWRMQESLQEKRGEFSLKDAAYIEFFLKKKYEVKQETMADKYEKNKPKKDELPTTEQETTE